MHTTDIRSSHSVAHLTARKDEMQHQAIDCDHSVDTAVYAILIASDTKVVDCGKTLLMQGEIVWRSGHITVRVSIALD